MKTHRNGKIRQSQTAKLVRIHVPFEGEEDAALLRAVEKRASKCDLSTGEMIARLCKDQLRRRGCSTERVALDHHRISFDLSETAYSILCAHAGVCGHNTPEDAARHAVATIATSTMEGLSQSSKEIHDIFETDDDCRDEAARS